MAEADTQSRNYNFLASARDWILRGQRVVPILALAGILLAVDLLAIDVHSHFTDVYLAIPPDKSPLAEYLLPLFQKYYILTLLFLIPAFVVHVFRNRRASLVFPFALGSLALVIAWLSELLNSTSPSFSGGGIGEIPSQLAHYGEFVLVFLLLISPPFIAWLYQRSSILSRYVVRSALVPLMVCLCSFIAIWLIIDLGDNAGAFVNADTNLLEIGYFYVAQIPQVLILVFPVTLLLSILYMLGRMSNSNELISMIGFGKSTMQILTPLFVIGLYATFACTVLNYQWAPWAEGHKESVLSKMNRGHETTSLAVSHLHHNGTDKRTWFISFIPFNMVRDPMATIEVRQLDEDDRLRETYYASAGKWNWRNKTWKLTNVVIYRYNKDGVPMKIETHDEMIIPDWSETPFTLVSSSFNPEYLGVPQLTSFLKTNRYHESRQLAPFQAHWHYRWSLPWSCFVVTLVAAPLGIVFSRRGLLGSVAAAIFVFFSMFFLEHLFLALGQGDHIPPFFSAWTNNLLFGAIGGILLYRRSRNRPLPGFGFIKGLLFAPRRQKT